MVLTKGKGKQLDRTYSSIMNIHQDDLLRIKMIDDINFEKNYEIVLPARKHWMTNEPTFEGKSLVYCTDSSKTGALSRVYRLILRLEIMATQRSFWQMCMRCINVPETLRTKRRYKGSLSFPIARQQSEPMRSIILLHKLIFQIVIRIVMETNKKLI